MTITDYPDWATPQAHADTISNTGVPLLSRPANLINQSGTVGSGGTVTVASGLAISKIGYEISLTFYAPATNQSIITVQCIWSDSVSGQQVETEQWDFYAGSGPIANAHIIRGTGPTKGDTLAVKVIQNLSTVTASYVIVMAQNSRVYTRDDWRTVFCGAVQGIPGTNGFLPQGNVLAQMDSVAVAAAGSVSALLPLYCGRVVISSTTTSATSDMQTLILDNTGGTGSFLDNQVIRGKTDANGNMVIVSAAFPRSQCLVQQVNNNAAAKDLLTFITSVDY